jgi:DNA replication ATP-dependent helicase Dna2
LLTRFKKTILIGDHMQLPAVSVQPENLGKIKSDHEWGQRIGLTDMSMSYFERLYRLYQSRGWHQLIGILSEQGRMHVDIMRFANQHVYHGQLQLVDDVRQRVALSHSLPGTSAPLFRERLIFVPSVSTLEETYLKTNQDEARIVIDLISRWNARIREYNLGWSIGVITPFRAQIAAITYLAHLQNIDLSHVTIDTVERYQGGARDIIIMSSTVNSRQTLSRITSVNADGVDRKLNVAVTRARQQFILIGTEKILKTEAAYKALIEMSVTMPVEVNGESHHPDA